MMCKTKLLLVVVVLLYNSHQHRAYHYVFYTRSTVVNMKF